MPGLWTIWSTPPFHTTQNQPYRPSQKMFRAKAVSFTSLMMALSRRESPRQTDEHSANTSGRRRQRFRRRARQRHTKTSRNREIRHNAAGGTQRCGLQRRHFASGGLFFSQPLSVEGVSMLARASITASSISSMINLLRSSSYARFPHCSRGVCVWCVVCGVVCGGGGADTVLMTCVYPYDIAECN